MSPCDQAQQALSQVQDYLRFAGSRIEALEAENAELQRQAASAADNSVLEERLRLLELELQQMRDALNAERARRDRAISLLRSSSTFTGPRSLPIDPVSPRQP